MYKAIPYYFLIVLVLPSCNKPSEPVFDSVYDEQSERFIPFADIRTNVVTQIRAQSAVSGGQFANDYGKPVTQKGVCWSLVEGPTVGGSCSQEGTGLAEFTSTLSALLADTTYYLRAYATNVDGTTYGGQLSFRTSDGVVVLGNMNVSEVSSTTATVTSFVQSDGGEQITGRGVCYATTENPTTESTCVSSGSGTGSFTANLTGLSEKTRYYLRSYATNAMGTGYGDIMQFTTTGIPPSVSTGAVSNVTTNSATVSGTVISQGGAVVTERGMCFNTTQNPTTNNFCIPSGSGIGSFSVTLENLLPGITYFVRAYAVNAEGNGYGLQQGFTTSVALPVVTTGSINSISATTASVSATVDFDGGAAITDRGFCYSRSQNPNLTDTCIITGNGTGIFTGNLQNLTPATQYYVNAYAKNSTGTAFGEQKSFTTEAAIPDVLTVSVSNIGLNNATVLGSVTNAGGAAVTERGVCYATSVNPTISGNCLSQGTGLGEFIVTLTNLIPSTNYYARAYARNAKGVAYGENQSFKTSDPPKWIEVTIANGTEITSIHFSGNQTGFVTAGNSIYRTTNGGGSWTAIQTINDIVFTAIYAADANIIYAGGHRGASAQTAFIYRSSNGGVTWQTVSEIWRQNERLKVEAIIAQNDGKVVALVTQSPNTTQTYGHVYSSTNSGSTWNSVTVPGISGVYAMTKNQSWLIIGGGRRWTGSNYVNTSHRSTFFSNQSTSLQSVNFGDGSQTFRAMDSINQTIAGVANNGYVLLSGDQGANWTIRRISGSETIDMNGIVMVSETTFLAIGNSGRLLRTTNSGISWNSPFGNPTTANITGLVYFSDSNLMIVTSDGKLLRYQ
jgi:photosystem II stability/assembly factor-like uncharacterized protein